MASQLPSTMRAITIQSNKAKVSSIALPKLRPTYVRVKVNAVALNPTDWKHIAAGIAKDGCISGCDFAGTVAEIGDKVKQNLEIGDRVAGVTHGANLSQSDDGCFAEYALAKDGLLIKVPDAMSFEAAATFPLGVSTVGQGLFQKALRLSMPPQQGQETPEHKEPVLIYGGSSATGSLGIQFAKLAGYKVYTTCSPRNTDFVKSLGADEVSDYKQSDCGASINKATNDQLKLAWDTISIKSSAKICDEALSSNGEGARYGSILPVAFPRKDSVEATSTLMYTIMDEPFEKFGQTMAAIPGDHAFAVKLYEYTANLLKEGKLKTHPEELRSEGLVGVLRGMQDMKADKVSGKKLVFRVADTPEGAETEVEL